MPDTALRATERQFLALLSAASGARAVRLRFVSLPQIPRGAAGRAHIAQFYESIDQLWDENINGLIVTGSEPRARALEDEPYWPALAQLTDWAEEHTDSTIWSCLAAQAAVLRTDRIARRPFASKLSGVFSCTKTAEHALMAGLPSCWRVPHTRYNDLPEGALTSSGYRVLSRLTDAGADMFVKEGRSLFLFLQGHPEYDPEALLREYRRDIARFLTGERDTYPDPIHDYFDERAETALSLFREQALRIRDPALLQRLAAALNGWAPPHDWREPAVQLYANWLLYLTQRKREAGDGPLRDNERIHSGVAGGF